MIAHNLGLDTADGMAKEGSVLESVSIVAYRGKAYLPTHARLGLGSYISVEPVIVADLTLEGLTGAINQLAQAGHPAGPNPLTREYWKTYREPIQKATRARSQKQLRREGRAYTVFWDSAYILLNLPNNAVDPVNDTQGVTQHLSPGTPMSDILGLILDNVRQFTNRHH